MVASAHQPHSIGKEAAIAIAESKWWESKTHREIAEFQMVTSELCCPFSVFHEAVTKTLGRSVFTHEFALNYDGICRELFHGATPPTFQQIVEMIPEEKRLLILIPDGPVPGSAGQN